MVHGIGTDILHIGKIAALKGDYNDPFFLKTFTDYERRQSRIRSDPDIYFATRFAAKEAVFKCFKIDSNHVRLNEIEIVSSKIGAPQVKLYGKLKKKAEELGMTTIQVSLSWDGRYALAFAVAQS